MVRSVCVVATSVALTVKSTQEQVSTSILQPHTTFANGDIRYHHTGPIPPTRCGPSSYCLNGGQCLSPLTETCRCPAGYLGQHCDVCKYQCRSVVADIRIHGYGHAWEGSFVCQYKCALWICAYSPFFHHSHLPLSQWRKLHRAWHP